MAPSVGDEVAQRLWVVIVAGVPTGVLVAGVGSRLAMFVLRLTSPDYMRGVTSDDGFEIGRFTLGGTYNLLMLGAGVGLIGAATYQAVRPWLLGPVWFQRFTVAAASGAVVGSILVTTEGIDFRLLTPLWLAIGLFVALPAVFAVAVAVAVDQVSAMPRVPGWRRWVLPAALVVPFPFAIFVMLVVAGALTLSVLVARGVRAAGGPPRGTGILVRGAWLGVAVLGLVALIDDVRTLA